MRNAFDSQNFSSTTNFALKRQRIWNFPNKFIFTTLFFILFNHSRLNSNWTLKWKYWMERAFIYPTKYISIHSYKCMNVTTHGIFAHSSIIIQIYIYIWIMYTRCFKICVYSHMSHIHIHCFRRRFCESMALHTTQFISKMLSSLSFFLLYATLLFEKSS